MVNSSPSSPLCFKEWLIKDLFCLNVLGHWGHWKDGFTSPSWEDATCNFMFLLFVKTWPQDSHEKGLFFSWILETCPFSLLFWENSWLHTRHKYGFFPSWTLSICCSKPLPLAIHFYHLKLVKVTFVVWIE